MDNKKFNQNISKLMKKTAELATCYSNKCGVLKNKLEEDKDYMTTIIQAITMNKSKKKDKLLDKLSKNELLYNYNKCILKNCKNIYKNLLNIIKINLNILPKTYPKYKEMNYYISELEKLINVKTLLTKEENKLFIKNSHNLMSTFMSKI
jgi:hypothetical protein